MLSELSGCFGHFQNFVNVVGEDGGEVWPRVPGHVGAQRGFTDVLGILDVPDLRHAATGPGRKEKGAMRTPAR